MLRHEALWVDVLAFGGLLAHGMAHARADAPLAGIPADPAARAPTRELALRLAASL